MVETSLLIIEQASEIALAFKSQGCLGADSQEHCSSGDVQLINDSIRVTYLEL
jgi:hypothetical protein